MLKLAVMLFVLVAFASVAYAQIYECIDAGGQKRFTNIKSEAKGCKLLDIGPFNVVPPPRPQGKAAPAPANFPKVDPQTQKERDGTRRRILEQELANEQKLLDQAHQQLAQESKRLGGEGNSQLEPYQKRVRQHMDNIANLRKELSGLR
jgi:hypothetical protein